MKHVLFVCLGNTCRSPLAAGLFNARNDPDAHATSAGLSAREGAPVTPLSADAARAYGADISAHTAHMLTARDVSEADLVVTLEPDYAAFLAKMFPGSSDKMLSLNIPDPYGGDKDVYDACAAEIFRQLNALLPDVRVGKANDLQAVAQNEKEVFSEPLSLASLQDLCAGENGLLYGLFVAGKQVAYIAAERADDEVQILSVGSLERRKGYAKTLMGVFLDHLCKDGVNKVFLEVRASNEAALHLYEKTGFVRDGVRPGLYTRPVEDGIIMHKDLKVCTF